MAEITLNTPKMFDLSGRTAFVTGAGSGIGQRIALGLAQCGANVALVDRRSDDGLAQTADAIAAAGATSVQIAADVTSGDAMAEAVARTEAELGPLTLCLNAAGIANANRIEEMEEDQYQTLMDINMKGIWLTCRAQGRAMIAHGKGGAIVNIASMSGVIVNRGLNQVHYNGVQGRGDPHVEIHRDGMGRPWHPGQFDLAGLYRHADEHPPRDGPPDQGVRKPDADAAHGLGR